MPSLIDAFSYQGTPWAMPHVLNVQSLYYNSAHLRGAGFRNPPATREESDSQMRSLRSRQAPSIDAWAEGEGLVSDFVRLAAQFGGDLFDANGHPQLQTRPVQRAAAFMRQLIDENLVRSEIGATNEPNAMRAFLSGSVTYTTNWKFVYGAMGDPAFSQIIRQGAEVRVPPEASNGTSAATERRLLLSAVLPIQQF